MHRWSRLSTKSLIDDRWLRVTADRCEIEPGKVIEPYYVVHENDWVHVYALNEHAALLTVRQYRYAADTFCIELPGGVVDPGEAPLAAAQRELLEETGHVAQRWSFVGQMFANPARQTNTVHVFLAEDLAQVAAQSLDASEDIIWSFQSMGTVEAAMLDGEFSQALHVASLFRAQQFLKARDSESARERA